MFSRRLEGPVLRRLEGSKPVLSASKEGEAVFGSPGENVAILMNQSTKRHCAF